MVIAVGEGFAAVSVPGRLEVIRRSPTVLLDVAHNPHGVEALAEAVTDAFASTASSEWSVCSSDKDAEGILSALEPLLAEVVITRSNSPRAVDPDDLGALAIDIFGEDRVIIEHSLPERHRAGGDRCRGLRRPRRRRGPGDRLGHRGRRGALPAALPPLTGETGPMRVIAASVLTFEGLIVLLAIPVAITLGGVEPSVAIAGGVALAVVCLVVAGSLSRPWGYQAGWVVQGLVLASGFVVHAMFLVGGLFVRALGGRPESRSPWRGAACRAVGRDRAGR